ncbi:hypothetical protein PCANC_08366 [Puccinia coronata f. sp. avenae]|nr:hypothetical protein PCANC_08366 [Puccinia coronata f. sp. avenae]
MGGSGSKTDWHKLTTKTPQVCQALDSAKADPVGTEPFSYEKLVADALDQASPSNNTASQHA